MQLRSAFDFTRRTTRERIPQNTAERCRKVVLQIIFSCILGVMVKEPKLRVRASYRKQWKHLLQLRPFHNR